MSELQNILQNKDDIELVLEKARKDAMQSLKYYKGKVSISYFE